MHRSGVRHRAFCRFCGALIPPTRTVCQAHSDLPAIERELRGDNPKSGGAQSAPEVRR